MINNSYNTERDLPSKGDFLYIFFLLVQKGKCDVAITIALLQELNKLVTSHTRLKRHCCSKKWVLRLLEILPTVDDDRMLSMLIFFIFIFFLGILM